MSLGYTFKNLQKFPLFIQDVSPFLYINMLLEISITINLLLTTYNAIHLHDVSLIWDTLKVGLNEIHLIG